MIVSRKKIKDNGTQKAVQRQRMGILLCEQNFWDVWRRNKSVRAEIGKILRTHTHTHAAKLVVRIYTQNTHGMFPLTPTFLSHRSVDFLPKAFDLFPDRDFCVISVPHLVPEFPLIQQFVVSFPASK